MEETDERIDYEKLKKQERIAFYDEVILFEDELADNGAAVFSVKIVRLCPFTAEVVVLCLLGLQSHEIDVAGLPVNYLTLEMHH